MIPAYMTAEGLEILRAELKDFKDNQRPAIIEVIVKARGFGDLSENDEYKTAQERYSFIERRIKELEDKISRAKVIEHSDASDGIIKFGLKIKLLDLGTRHEMTIRLVGEDEAGTQEGAVSINISINSPLAKELLGKKIGEIVDILAPSGDKEYQVLDVFA